MLSILVHIAAHSLTKTLLFQCAGNLLLAFRTRAISVVQGLGASMKVEAALLLMGFLFICGMPPSALFLSELGLIFLAPVWVGVIVLILLFIVFAAMMKVVLGMTMGRAPKNCHHISRRLYIVPGALLIILVSAGVFASWHVAAIGGVK
jgi:hydrogenase-4 component F